MKVSFSFLSLLFLSSYGRAQLSDSSSASAPATASSASFDAGSVSVPKAGSGPPSDSKMRPNSAPSSVVLSCATPDRNCNQVVFYDGSKFKTATCPNNTVCYKAPGDRSAICIPPSQVQPPNFPDSFPGLSGQQSGSPQRPQHASPTQQNTTPDPVSNLLPIMKIQSSKGLVDKGIGSKSQPGLSDQRGPDNFTIPTNGGKPSPPLGPDRISGLDNFGCGDKLTYQDPNPNPKNGSNINDSSGAGSNRRMVPLQPVSPAGASAIARAFANSQAMNGALARAFAFAQASASTEEQNDAAAVAVAVASAYAQVGANKDDLLHAYATAQASSSALAQVLSNASAFAAASADANAQAVANIDLITSAEVSAISSANSLADSFDNAQAQVFALTKAYNDLSAICRSLRDMREPGNLGSGGTDSRNPSISGISRIGGSSGAPENTRNNGNPGTYSSPGSGRNPGSSHSDKINMDQMKRQYRDSGANNLGQSGSAMALSASNDPRNISSGSAGHQNSGPGISIPESPDPGSGGSGSNGPGTNFLSSQCNQSLRFVSMNCGPILDSLASATSNAQATAKALAASRADATSSANAMAQAAASVQTSTNAWAEAVSGVKIDTKTLEYARASANATVATLHNLLGKYQEQSSAIAQAYAVAVAHRDGLARSSANALAFAEALADGGSEVDPNALVSAFAQASAFTSPASLTQGSGPNRNAPNNQSPKPGDTNPRPDSNDRRNTPNQNLNLNQNDPSSQYKDDRKFQRREDNPSSSAPAMGVLSSLLNNIDFGALSQKLLEILNEGSDE